jgi:hypothetical protein
MCMSTRSTIDLLLVHADDQTPVLDDGITGVAAAVGSMPTSLPGTGWLWSESVDANDLERQRWGIVAPQGPTGRRLLDAVAPLRLHREAEQGGHAAQIYQVPPHLSLAEAMQWKQRYLRRDQDLEVDVPRYLLVLGDLDQVPASVQTALATDGFVGRLAFDHEDDYRTYVDKVLRWEAQPATTSVADAVLHTVHDDTAASINGHRALMVPGLAILQERRQLGDVRVHDLRAAGSTPPTPDDAWAATTTGRPCVLFSHAHGEGAPRSGWRSPALQRRYQGAMSFGRGLRLTGRDVLERTFLPGGVWLVLACFSAGTPTRSGYQHWLEELHRLGHVGRELSHIFDSLALERPFVAALPKAVLANPNGPLAFIGHLDLAWSYSFMQLGPGAPRERPGRFMNLVQSLLAGDRAGVAIRTLLRALGEIHTELSALVEHTDQGRILSRHERAQRAHLWMLRQDLADYVLLGDPAVRLPLADRARPRLPAATIPERTGALMRGNDDPALPLPIDELERVVVMVLRGDTQIGALAYACGLDEAELLALSERYRAGGRRALQGA